MMEIARMNQTCPHCQALVILPELVRNYGDMPIQWHDCESSFFLPTDQLSKSVRLCAFSAQIAHHPCQFALGGVYPAGAAFFWPFASGFSSARSGFNWNPPLW
jgi:hypothetical protein